MKVIKLKLIIILLNTILFVACTKKIEEKPNNQIIDGELFGTYWDGNKFTISDFYKDDSKDTNPSVNKVILRLPKNLKIDIIEKSEFSGKSVTESVNEIKNNYKIIQQGINYYNRNDTLKLYSFFLIIEIPHYLDMVEVLFYFDHEYTLENKYLYQRQIISDSSEIKRINNILANEYKYEILQRTFISSKD